MKKIIAFLIIISSSIFIGCKDNKDLLIDEDSKITIEDVNIENQEILNQEESKNNIIVDKGKIDIENNEKNVKDLNKRNNSIKDEYIRAINIVKEFSNNNSLNLTYVEPINDRISRFSDDMSLLLQDLADNGAETVNYFTDEEILNVDLSIQTSELINLENDYTITGVTYDGVIYKASIANIDSNFDFENSKLNEFRTLITDNNSLDYDKVNKYIYQSVNEGKNTDKVFLNKLNDDSYEIIRVENNNCYYKFVYDPKF